MVPPKTTILWGKKCSIVDQMFLPICFIHGFIANQKQYKSLFSSYGIYQGSVHHRTNESSSFSFKDPFVVNKEKCYCKTHDKTSLTFQKCSSKCQFSPLELQSRKKKSILLIH